MKFLTSLWSSSFLLVENLRSYDVIQPETTMFLYWSPIFFTTEKMLLEMEIAYLEQLLINFLVIQRDTERLERRRFPFWKNTRMSIQLSSQIYLSKDIAKKCAKTELGEETLSFRPYHWLSSATLLCISLKCRDMKLWISRHFSV